MMKWVAGLVATIAMLPTLAAWELNMPKGITDSSQEIYGLHMLIFYVCVWIGVVVFSVMIYSIIKHRKSVHPEPATFTHSNVAEVTWTAVPVIILIVMAYPAAKTLVKLEDSSASDLTIQVTGYQWNWHYEYPEEGISFYSRLSQEANIARQVNSGIDPTSVPNYLRDVDNPMVVPVGKKIRLLLTAADVIHAWWVPELTGKRDAIPGFVNSLWFKANRTGTFRGQCAELCGRDHGFMPIVVKVLSEADYAAWVRDRADTGMTAAVTTAATDSAADAGAAALDPPVAVAAAASTSGGDAAPDMTALILKGESVYAQHCVACHQANGQGLPPAFPALTAGAITTGPIDGHINIILNGSPGTAMIAFGALLSDADIAAVVTYERNALGNSVGDMAAPADVAALRGE
ncbi:MAG: cytochrome c oxidase subunit II [Gammaproteobacteria bacterium]|nr:cytochrome c oxidase subunit II [Gammaproteobacteria bacterium]